MGGLPNQWICGPFWIFPILRHTHMGPFGCSGRSFGAVSLGGATAERRDMLDVEHLLVFSCQKGTGTVGDGILRFCAVDARHVSTLVASYRVTNKSHARSRIRQL